MIKLNETPVRTSRNFNINNIEIEDANIMNNVGSFNNVQIKGETSNINIDTKLAYGINNILEKQIKSNANQKIVFEIEKEDKEVVFKFDKNNSCLVDNIKILAKENSKGQVIIKYESDNEIKAYHNGLINVEARENAKLDIIIINMTSITSQNFLTIQNELNENAKVNYTIVDFGGENSITNLYSNLVGAASCNNINTIYLGKENQLFDLNYIAELSGQNTKVNIEVQGALKDEAKKHLKGTIDFKKGCKKAKGNENESCMLLSNKAKSIALPMLLCSEEDVEGNHSCSSGKVGNKELFYIMSRGFSQKEAMKLLVKAKFNNILKEIKDSSLQEEILKRIDEKLN